MHMFCRKEMLIYILEIFIARYSMLLHENPPSKVIGTYDIVRSPISRGYRRKVYSLWSAGRHSGSGIRKNRIGEGPSDFGSCHSRDTLARWYLRGTIPRAIDFSSLRTGSANCGGRRRTSRVSFVPPYLPVRPFFSRPSFGIWKSMSVCSTASSSALLILEER